MSIWFAIFLGLVQGVSEFLPISSSGHLSIFQNLFHMEGIEQDHVLFDVLLHLGTLVAVCIVYRKELVEMFRAIVELFRDLRRPQEERVNRNPKGRLFLLLVIATLPLLIILPINNLVEGLYYNTTFIGIALLLTGCILFVSTKLAPGRKNERNATILDALVVGGCQAIAVVPGLSRSGTTITAGLVRGFDREFSVRFSFLLSIPAILGANLLSLFQVIRDGAGDNISVWAYVVGTLVAAVSGYFAIRLVKRLTKKDSFGKFAYYCWAVGLLTILLSIIL